MSVVIGGIYEHYKGNKYKVIGVAKHSETLENLVVYQALYGENDLWVRPYEMFCEKFVKEGKEIERFKYLGDELNQTYRIYLEISEDLKSALSENSIDLEKELVREIGNIDIEYVHIDDGNHKKDVGMVILAVGVSVSAVLMCVAKLIRIVNERPREAKIIERNSEGYVIKEKTILLEPQKVPQKTEIDFEVGTHDIKFKITDEN